MIVHINITQRMFTIENMEHSIIKITIIETITLDELKKILGVLTRVFNTKKNFAFIVYCNISEVPVDISILTKYLLSWMKETHQDIINYLQGSAIVIKSDLLVAIFNGIFKIQPTVKPNCITTNHKRGEEFITKIMKKI
jgi:hypothetical protein